MRWAFFALWSFWLASTEAIGQQLDNGSYVNLLLSGDGETPAAVSLLAKTVKQTSSGQYGAQVSPLGDAQFSVSIESPTALLTPAVGLSYNSSAGIGWLGRGWSLNSGVTIQRAHTSRYGEHVYLVQGEINGELHTDTGTVWIDPPKGTTGSQTPVLSTLAWRSATPSHVEAVYAAGTWTLHSGSRTYTLQPTFPGTNADVWHTTRIQDTVGNRADYSWAGSRLLSVDYGGYGDTENPGHFLRLRFLYGSANAHTHRRGMRGAMDVFDLRLTSIEVQTKHGGLSDYATRLAYVLTYASRGELLEVIDQEDHTVLGAGASRNVAQLFYTGKVDDYEEVPEAPEFLGLHTSGTWIEGEDEIRNWTQTVRAFQDTSGDGLPDYAYVERNATSWQYVDADGFRVWEEYDEATKTDYRHGLFNMGGVLDASETVLVADSGDLVNPVQERDTYYNTVYADVDGDGKMDQIRATVVPVVFSDSDKNFDYRGENSDEDLTADWDIAYGNNEGVSDLVNTEEAPFKFPRIERQPHLPEWLATAHPDHYDSDVLDARGSMESAWVDLMDMDGDGWLDVIHIPNDGTLLVYWRVPGRGNGWEEEPQRLLENVVGLASTAATRGWVEEEWVDGTETQFTLGLGNTAQDVERPQFDWTETLTGFHDMNGDGLPDYVDARHGGTSNDWRVYLNNGDGFESWVTWEAHTDWITRAEEGRTAIEFCPNGLNGTTTKTNLTPMNAEPALVSAWDGSASLAWDWTSGCLPAFAPYPSAVVGGLLDMNGDGLPDFIDGENEVWYRNNGDGFGVSSKPLPAWFPRSDVDEGTDPAGVLAMSVSHQMVTDVTVNYPVVTTSTVAGLARVYQAVVVRDVDMDGLPDVVDLRDVPHVRYSGRTVDGSGDLVAGGTRPGLLEAIESGAGRTTEIEYVSSTTVYPSAVRENPVDPTLQLTHETNSRKDVVAAVTVTDDVTGWAAREERTYSDGKVVMGQWWGFDHVVVDEFSTEPDLEVGEVPASADWTLLSTTTTDYHLDVSWVLPSRRVIHTEATAAHVPGATAPPAFRDRIETTWTYQFEWAYTDPNSKGSPWVRDVEVVQWSDPRTGPSPAFRDWTVSLTYDGFGNMLSQHHVDDDRTSDEIFIDTVWVSDINDVLFRPSSITTSSVESVVADTPPSEQESFIDVEEVRLSYDGEPFGAILQSGVLTGESACSGNYAALCASEVAWSFGRNGRGALTLIEHPNGMDTFNDVLGFGSSRVLDQKNALQHQTTSVIDDLGRTVRTTDPNGVVTIHELDGYGRITKLQIQGAGALAPLTKETRTYSDDTVPRYVDRAIYRGGVPVLTERTLLDGFGRPLQTFKPIEHQAGGERWVVVDTEKDARGLDRRTSEPRVELALSTAYERGAVTNSWSYYDGMGQTVAQWSLSGGRTDFDEPEPGTRRSVDAEGFWRDEVADTHGRLIEVKQGRNGTTAVTGEYAYDGRDRVIRFTDGAGNVWRYDYDGMGRLVDIDRRAASDAPLVVFEDYYELQWDGALPIAMFEGIDDGAPESEWFYDLLGRPTLKYVWNSVRGARDSYTWTYDSLTGGASWVGATIKSTDPSGETTHAYAADPVFGGFGWVTQTERFWPGAAPADERTATFTYTYDENGKRLTHTWPSGTTVSSTYLPDDRVATQQVGTDWMATYLYNDDEYGQLGRWEVADLTVPMGAGLVWSQDVYMANSSQVDRLSWELHDSTDPTNVLIEELDVQYGYYANGQLRYRDYTGEPGVEYTYDDLSRIEGVHVYPGPPAGGIGADLETYVFDAASNPMDFWREGAGGPAADPGNNLWSYLPTDRFNEVPGRFHTVSKADGGGKVTEAFTYDAMSRLDAWDTNVPAGFGVPIDRIFTYDGASRLIRIDRTSGGWSLTTDHYYTVANGLVFEDRNRNGVRERTWRFEGWLEDEANSKTIEQWLPMLRNDGGTVKAAYLEPEGRAAWTRDALGGGHQEISGAFGLPVDQWTVNGPWELDGLHASEPDVENEVAHFGARHMALRDGSWLQPEPLLYMGIHNGNLNLPLGFSGLYAAGNPNALQDRSGYSGLGIVPMLILGMSPSSCGGTCVVDDIQFYGAQAVAATALTLHPGPEDLAIAYVVSARVAGGMGSRAGVFAGAMGVSASVRRTTSGCTGPSGGCGGGACFVAGTDVVVSSGFAPIEQVEVGDRVMSHVVAEPAPAERPWIELSEPEEASGEAGSACSKLAKLPRRWVLPALMLAACGQEPVDLPASTSVVQIYEARSGQWLEGLGAELEVGDTFLDDGRLRRWTTDGLQDRGAAEVEDLAEADATWLAGAVTRDPTGDDWVLVLGEGSGAGHWTLGSVEAGATFAFQARVFEAADGDGDGLLEVRPTGDALGRVSSTFVRVAPEVIDAEIAYDDGATSVLTGTPNHPFWVDAVRDYVPLGELELGTELHVQGGGAAILVSKTWRQAEFEVFDFEVDGLHNFYVRGPAGGDSGVLVHNSDGGNFVYRALREGENPADGLAARNPGGTLSPRDHVRNGSNPTVAAKSPWISTTKDPAKVSQWDSGNGVVRIDLDKVDSQVLDVSDGIPGTKPRDPANSYAKGAAEVLIRDYAPAEAVTVVSP